MLTVVVLLLEFESSLLELLELVEKELKRAGRARKLPGGVIFTGGTSQIDGLDIFAKDKLELPARIGAIQEVGGLVDAAASLQFATPIGLMLLDMLLEGQHPTGHPNNYVGMIDNFTALIEKFKRR